jgi:hypothetical protein
MTETHTPQPSGEFSIGGDMAVRLQETVRARFTDIRLDPNRPDEPVWVHAEHIQR